MSAPRGDRECQRCSVGTCAVNSVFCIACNRTINNIIARAVEGGMLTSDDIAEEVGLSRGAVEQRRHRIRKAARQEAA